MLTIKIRYKKPDGGGSTRVERALADLGAEAGAPSRNLLFSAAVAEFGMLLRDSKHKGGASFDQVSELARRGRGEDPRGYRAEFARLAELAASLTTSRYGRK